MSWLAAIVHTVTNRLRWRRRIIAADLAGYEADRHDLAQLDRGVDVLREDIAA